MHPRSSVPAARWRSESEAAGDGQMRTDRNRRSRSASHLPVKGGRDRVNMIHVPFVSRWMKPLGYMLQDGGWQPNGSTVHDIFAPSSQSAAQRSFLHVRAPAHRFEHSFKHIYIYIF